MEGGEFRHYCVKMEDPDSILTISLQSKAPGEITTGGKTSPMSVTSGGAPEGESVDSDADLFVSTVTVPSVVDYDWKSYALGDDRVVIHPSDPRAKAKGFYFIGVFAYERAVEFSIVATKKVEKPKEVTKV